MALLGLVMVESCIVSLPSAPMVRKPSDDPIDRGHLACSDQAVLCAVALFSRKPIGMGSGRWEKLSIPWSTWL